LAVKVAVQLAVAVVVHLAQVPLEHLVDTVEQVWLLQSQEHL
jgi:hypothetical protein